MARKTAKINITVQEDTREALTGAFSYGDVITRDFGATESTYYPTVDPAFSDGAVITYSIDPAVDNTGISLDTTNGALTVNSTANAQTTTYTVTASVSSSSTTHKGSVEARFTLTINPLPITALTYSPIVAFIGSPIAVASPTLTPTGASATYTIDSALPDGLTLTEDTGEISGIPTAVQTAANYAVTATGTGNYSGTLTADISITVQADTRPAFTGAFSYVDIIRDFGAGGDTYRPTVDPGNPFSADGLTITYSISPAVDGTGISFDTTTGELTVNSSANAQTQLYTVTARSSTHSGPLEASVTLTINRLPITALTYSNATISVSPGSTIPDAIPALTPTGASVTYTIKPALPTGLSLDSDGKISGATTVLGTAVYTVTATASGNYSGTQTATISITVQVEDTPAILSATNAPRSTATGTEVNVATDTRVGLTFEYDKHRVHHVIFSLTSDITANATIVAKAAAEKAPTADEINAATAKMVVTAGPTAVNVYLAYHIDAVLTTNDINVLLKANTPYSIYGMNNVGTVTKLIDITTDSVPTLNINELYGIPPFGMTFAIKNGSPLVIYGRGTDVTANSVLRFEDTYAEGSVSFYCYFEDDNACLLGSSPSALTTYSRLPRSNENGPMVIAIINPMGHATITSYAMNQRLGPFGSDVRMNYTSGTFTVQD